MIVAILHGLFEGPQTSRAFARELVRRGHRLTDDQTKADVIIAHSGGWVFIDEPNPSTRIILVDPSYRDEHSLLARHLRRLARDLRHIPPAGFTAIARLRALNVWYAFTTIPQTRNMKRRSFSRNISELLSWPQLQIIIPSDSGWHNPRLVDDSLVTITSGDHDELWHHPAKYCDIIEL